MNYRDVKKLVKKHGGWVEPDGDDVVFRFPSPHQKDSFERELAVVQENKVEELSALIRLEQRENLAILKRMQVAS